MANTGDGVLSKEETLLENARLAEMAEMHTEMAEFMKELVENSDSKLSKSARNLLSVAYKNLVGSKRSSWRVVSSHIINLKKEEKKECPEDEKKAITARRELSEAFLEKIVKELKEVCKEVVDLLDEKLIKNANDDAEEKTFYCKMKGDYYRYLSEVLKDSEDDFKEAKEKSEKAYKSASEAGEDLAPTNPVLLGNKLNFSVFYYEIMNNPEEACKLAKEAFDKAIGELDSLKEDSYKDSTLIMQLLRDNLTLWTAEGTEEDSKDKEED